MNAPSWSLQQHFKLDVSPKDLVRLSGPLKTYRSLHELILLNQFTPEDLKKMLIIELNHGRRPWMVRRLVQHIIRIENAHIKNLSALSLDRSIETVFGTTRGARSRRN